jgi:hypothetical protein
MVRTRTLAVLLLALAPAALLAAPVPSGGKAKDVTELPVADKSMVVIQLNGIDRTKGRLMKMLEGIDPAKAKESAKEIDEWLKSTAEDRDLTGLDGQGRVFVAIGALAELGADETPVAVLLPVKDYKTFREKVLTKGEQKSFQKGKGGVDEVELETTGSTLYLVDTGTGYVVASPSKDTAEVYAGKYDKLTVKQLGSVAEGFLAADVSVFVNVARVNEEYGGDIAAARAAVGQLFQLFGQQLDQGQAAVAKSLIDGLFQIVEDATGVVIAVDFRPEGFGLRVDGAFTAGSESDKVLSAETPAALKSLADLPKGWSSYSASKWGKGIGGIQRKLTSEFASDDDKATAAIEKLTDLLAASDGETVGLSGQGFASLTAGVYADPKKVADAKLAVFKALDEGAKYSNLALKGKPKVTADAQKHAGFSLHAAAIEIDFEASVKATADAAQKEAAIEAMKKLMPEKQTVFFGTDGKRFVQVSAKDWDEAKKLLDAFTTPKEKAGADKAFAVTRGQLPAEANYLLLSDANTLFGLLSEYAGSLGDAIPGGPGAELPKIGKVKGDPAFVGVAVVAKKQSARLEVFVPVAALKSLAKAAEVGEKEKKDE